MKLKLGKPQIKGDKVIWIVYLVLSVLSLIFVFSSMGKVVYHTNGDITRMFIKQVGIIVGGIALTYFVHHFKYTTYKRFKNTGYGFSLFLLSITLLIGGLFGKAANRWLELPIIGQLQPSEIVKYILIVYVAAELSELKSKIKDKVEFWKLVGKIVLVCGLIVLENFSTAFIIFLACFLLLFIGGARFKYLLLIVSFGLLVVLGFAGADALGIEIGRNFTWVNRVESFLNNDPNEANQYNYAIMAIATGGTMGVGIGNTVMARFLSESHNDFIFSVILEQGGIFICILILLAYFILFYRCLLVSREAKGLFGAYAAAGISFVIIIQALINMIVATGLSPITGQTLPFLSYGGTSFLISSFAIGIILNISAESKKAIEEEQHPTTDVVEKNSEIDNTNNNEI
ncbi:MAG: FtsW/RodA/SpoVE family cell cycle protein [Bacteroidales bacterium]|nr:FtsW/RodA/SpoVE family cell cycle protein [Bacteroidales bacterium]